MPAINLAQIVQGFDGYAGMGIQASIGTGVPATIFQKTTEVGVSYKEPGRKVVEHIAKNRQYVDYVRGPIEVNGAWKGYFTPDEACSGQMFASLLGGSNTVSGSVGTGFTHTFNDSGAFSVNGATIEAYKGGSAVMFDLIGMYLSKYSLSAAQDGPAMFDTEWLGTTEELGGTVSTATFAAAPPMEGWMATIQVGASIGASMTTIPVVQSFNFTYDNKLSPLRGIGSRYNVGRVLGRPEITLEFVMQLMNDVTYYNYFKNNTNNAVILTLTHDSLAGTSSGAYSVTIKLPNVVWLGESPTLNGMEAQNHNMKLQALYSSSAGYTCQIASVNSYASTYSC